MTNSRNQHPAPTQDQYLQQAIAHHRAGRLADAERLYRAILRVEPRHPDANHNLGILAVQASQPAAALPHFKAALEVNPKQEQYRLSYIDALIQAGQTAIARNVLAQGRQRGLRGGAADSLAERLEGPFSDEINTLAALFNQGRYAEGEALSRRLTERFPQNGFGWKMLGAALKLQGSGVKALEPMMKAVELLPQDAEAYSNLGIVLQEQGRLMEAEISYRRALAIEPDYAEAYNNLGANLKEQGRLTDAEACYRRALAIKPDYAEAHNNLGNALNEQGRLADAEISYRRALAIKPNYVEAYNNLGVTLQGQGRLTEAEAGYQRALAIKPDYAEAYNNLGNALKEQGRFADAEAGYRRALAIMPDYADAHYNLGITLQEQGRLTEAEADYRRALAIKPDYADAYINLGNALKEQGRLTEAEAAYGRALAIKPDFAEAHSNLGNILREQGRLKDAEAIYRRALAIRPDYVEVYSNLLFTLNCDNHYTPSYCLKEARRYGHLAADKTEYVFSSWQCEARPERLRVGLVSGDLSNHAVGYFLEDLITHFDPARVELMAYPTHPGEDNLTARLKPCFAGWKPLSGRSDEVAARMIHADGIHVLLDLSGHTAYNRLPLFAWKPAPVQAAWLGYFATTGVTEMDYILVDEIGVPEKNREHFSEKVLYLPDTRLCYSVPKHEIAVAPSPALTHGYITFGCFQNLCKVTDSVLEVWGAVLTRLPEARLRFHSKQLDDKQFTERLQARLTDFGIGAHRIGMHGASARDEYLAAHSQVDLILDTFPYPGGATTCEALWMGVPTLTLVGNTLLSRQGASLLSAAGLHDWIAVDRESYIEKAVIFASDLSELAKRRATLRERVLLSPLFDAQRFARNFETTLWKMWSDHHQLLSTPTIREERKRRLNK